MKAAQPLLDLALVVCREAEQQALLAAGPGIIGRERAQALRPLDLGIEGECEGSAACATCHVWVDPAWIDRLAAPSDAEQDMLDCAFDTRATSRLSCQIRLGPDLGGLTFTVPGGG